MNAARSAPRLITPGVIACDLRAPLHRVLHVLATRQHIPSAARAGTLRLYDRRAVAMVRHELNAIDARRCRRGWRMPAEPILPMRPAAAATPADAAEDLRGRPEAHRPLLVSARDAARLCGVSVATWHRLASAGRCPAPLRLSRGCVRWRAEDLRDWVAAGCPSRREWEARRAAGNASGRPGGAGR